jgi:hypothetical protein
LLQLLMATTKATYNGVESRREGKRAEESRRVHKRMEESSREWRRPEEIRREWKRGEIAKESRRERKGERKRK